MKAFAWMSGGLFMFCLMALAGRELAGAVSTFEILFFRSLIGLALITAIILRTGNRALFATQRLGLHAGRNVSHFIGQYGWFLGLGLLPLAQVFALEFTTPLWTLLVARVFLGEALTGRKLAALALGLVGVWVILNPDGGIVQTASLYVLGAAFFYAMAHTTTKALTPTEHPLTILFYMCVVQLPLGLVLGAAHFVMPHGVQWFWLCMVGLSALGAHYCMTHAMKHAEASVVVTLDFLRLPLIGLLGVSLYGEPFSLTLLLGATLMLAGNLLNLYRPRR